MDALYFDHAATTPCDPRVRAVMLNALEQDNGNPHSTTHASGRKAAELVERARADVAALIGADPREIIFTSGATEANNLAIKGAARHLVAMGSPRRRVITVATEHKCVLESVRDLAQEGFEPVILPVDAAGCWTRLFCKRRWRSPPLWSLSWRRIMRPACCRTSQRLRRWWSRPELCSIPIWRRLPEKFLWMCGVSGWR